MPDNKKTPSSSNSGNGKRGNLNESYNKIPDFKYTPPVPKPKEDNTSKTEKGNKE